MTKEYFVAMPTRNSELYNKDYDYQVLGFIASHSNFDNAKDAGYDKNIFYGETWTYFNKLDFGGYGMKNNSTFEKKIKKMLDIDDSLLSIENRHGELIYRIDYAKEGKYFVRIHHEILKALIKGTNKDVIKLYCWFSYMLLDGNKQISEGFIAEKFNWSRATVSSRIKILVALGLIKRDLKPTPKSVLKTNSVTMKTYITKEYEYSLVDFYTWKQFYNSL